MSHAPWRIPFAVGAVVAFSLGLGGLGSLAPGASLKGTTALAAGAKPRPRPSPSPSPSPTPSSANWIHAFVAPTLDASCASPASQVEDVQPTSDGGYVVAGSTQVSTSSTSCASIYDGWIGKLDSTGHAQWQETLGCGGSFYGFKSVQQTVDGGYILAGGEEGCSTPQCVSGGFGALNCAAVVKLDSTGRLQWQQFYPGAFQSNADQVRQTSDGGYIFVGTTQDTFNNTFAWVARLDASGNSQWQRQISGRCSPLFAEADSVQQTSDGGYIVGGGFDYSSNCNASLLAIRLDAGGNVIWQQGYAVGGHARPNASIRPVSDGGYVMSAIAGFQSADGSSEDAMLMKIDSSGAIQWQKRYHVGQVCYYNVLGNYTCSDFGALSYGMRQTADGGYVLVGAVQVIDSSDGLPVLPAWLLKTDASGNVQWQHDYYAVWAPTGHVLGSNFYGVAQATDGGFVAVGDREYYNLQANEAWVVKTDSNGNVGACGEVHSVTTTALNVGLTGSASGLPVNMVANGGENVTSSGGTAAGKLGLVQDC